MKKGLLITLLSLASTQVHAETMYFSALAGAMSPTHCEKSGFTGVKASGSTNCRVTIQLPITWDTVVTSVTMYYYDNSGPRDITGQIVEYDLNTQFIYTPTTLQSQGQNSVGHYSLTDSSIYFIPGGAPVFRAIVNQGTIFKGIRIVYQDN